jgi:chromosome segregation ATPase
MNSERLRRILEQLHAELASTDTVDSELRKRLQELRSEVSEAMKREHPPASLRDRLEDGVAQFEASHPTVARRMAEVIDTLALYGL